jgi:hypothetical protein
METLSMFLNLSRSTLMITLALAWSSSVSLWADDLDSRVAPLPEEQQLPYAMHSRMEQRPHILVGQSEADIVGSDNRALQAAVDYVAALGGGTVTIGPGEFLMHDSLHLRSHVTIRGTKGKTVLRKAGSAASDLVLDGDFGEQQVTVQDASGFEVGSGVAIWDDRAGGFHTKVARITGRTGNTFSIDKPLMADCMVHNRAQAATVFPVVMGKMVSISVMRHMAWRHTVTVWSITSSKTMGRNERPPGFGFVEKRRVWSLKGTQFETHAREKLVPNSRGF